jgi:hypothetical protein
MYHVNKHGMVSLLPEQGTKFAANGKKRREKEKDRRWRNIWVLPTGGKSTQLEG